jgi:hypothetical protein
MKALTETAYTHGLVLDEIARAFEKVAHGILA